MALPYGQRAKGRGICVLVTYLVLISPWKLLFWVLIGTHFGWSFGWKRYIFWYSLEASHEVFLMSTCIMFFMWKNGKNINTFCLKKAFYVELCVNPCPRGWSGGAKVLCILHHWGVQLILAYSWARPAILVVGKGRGGMFLFLLFLHFHSCSSFFPVPLFHLLYSLFYLFSPFLWETTQNDPQGLTCR